MKRDAVQLCTCCICGCTVHTRRLAGGFLQATETGPNSEENFTNRQGLKNAENSNCSSSNGFGPTLTTMKLPAGWPATLTKLSAGSPRPFVESPTCFKVNRVVIFFVALKLLSFSLPHLLTARNGSVLFLGPCQVLVMQSFAFSCRLSKVGSLIEWLLSSSLCICRENPTLRILNSPSSCRNSVVLVIKKNCVRPS